MEEFYKKIPNFENWLEFKQICYNLDDLDVFCSKITKNEISKNQIDEQFAKRLKFGTAGLRGKMEMGFNRFNAVTVIQSTQGVATYLMEKFGSEACQNKGVVIGYDGRIDSDSFAQCAAAVFISLGFCVYTFGEPTPTPFVPYTLLKKGCVGGVMITASHNPKEDNGYKLYGNNGAQILSPWDTDIMQCILNNLGFWPKVKGLLKDDGSCYLRDQSSLKNVYDEMVSMYTQDISKELKFAPHTHTHSTLKVAYTPVHGVGYKAARAITHAFGFDDTHLIPVPSQKEIDGNFPTITFPNPEEMGALDEAKKFASAHQIPIIFANDPDADRFSLCELHNGEWYQFSGDQIGVMLAAHLLDCYKKLDVHTHKMMFISTIVSSRMLKSICEQEGAHYFDTLTGFKWIMSKALENPNYTPVLMYEEAIGFAPSMQVRDKDGISTLGVFMEIAHKLHTQGHTFSDYLHTLYKKYGHFYTQNGYFLCYDPKIMDQIFDQFRQNGLYTWKIGNIKIESIKDITLGYDSTQADFKSSIPPTPGSQMICLTFENGGTATIRTSGTEPKIKYYCEMGVTHTHTPTPHTLNDIVQAIISDIYQPNKYEVYPPKD